MLPIEPHLIDEKLELDDGCSALVLTVALHTWTTESEVSASRETQRHLQDVFTLLLTASTLQLSRGQIWDFVLLLLPRVRLESNHVQSVWETQDMCLQPDCSTKR